MMDLGSGSPMKRESIFFFSEIEEKVCFKKKLKRKHWQVQQPMQVSELACQQTPFRKKMSANAD